MQTIDKELKGEIYIAIYNKDIELEIESENNSEAIGALLVSLQSVIDASIPKGAIGFLEKVTYIDKLKQICLKLEN